MSEPKWTPKPWTVVDVGKSRWVIRGPDVQVLFLPNASLIAAAPELYEALAEACDLIEGMLMGAKMLRGDAGLIEIEQTEETVRFRTLLAKARGETMQRIGRETNSFWHQGYRDGLDGRKAEIPDEARNMSQRRDYFDGYDAGQGDPPLPRE